MRVNKGEKNDSKTVHLIADPFEGRIVRHCNKKRQDDAVKERL